MARTKPTGQQPPSTGAPAAGHPPPHAPSQAARVPNVYWRSLSMDALRQQPRCIALPPPPPAADARLIAATHHRYVRQGTELWSALHDSVLTSSRLKGALGMHAPAAAALIGLHPGQRGASHLLSAYWHLVGAPSSSSRCGPPPAGTTTTSSRSSKGSKSRRRKAGRQQEQQLAPSLLQPPLPGVEPPQPQQQPLSPAAIAARTAELEQQRQQYNATSEAGASGFLQDQEAVVAAARAASQRAAAGGDVAVKLAWGTVQEAAALHCVLQAFPASLLEEVGLFRVEAAVLPAAWGVNLEQLPPLGASPDAVLLHTLQLQQADLQAAAALLQRHVEQATAVAAAGSRGQHGGSGGPASGAASASALAASLAASDAETAAVQLLLQRGYDRLACAGERPRKGVPLADSSSSEGAVSSDDSERGSCSEGEGAAGASASSLGGQPPSGNIASSSSSPATGPMQPPPPLEGAGGLGALEPVAVSALRVLRAWQQQQQQQATEARGQDGSEQQSVTLVVREAVEVKSHCVFAARKRVGKRGSAQLSYSFSPRGCASRVQAQWIPQLQLHMLATGCQSALLASRCAERGMRVFRVWRDQAYLRTMLGLLQRLQVEHVQRGVPPTRETFAGDPAHRRFLQRTVQLARGAECIAALDEAFVARVPASPVNRDKFWHGA